MYVPKYGKVSSILLIVGEIENINRYPLQRIKVMTEFINITTSV